MVPRPAASFRSLLEMQIHRRPLGPAESGAVGGWAAVCVLTIPLADSDARSHLRPTQFRLLASNSTGESTLFGGTNAPSQMLV